MEKCRLLMETEKVDLHSLEKSQQVVVFLIETGKVDLGKITAGGGLPDGD